MAHIVEITDFHQPELDLFARMTQTQLRNRLEPEKGIFIAESPKVIDVALDSGCQPVAMLMSKRHAHGQGERIAQRCGEIPAYTADEEILTQLTGYSVTRGVLCAMRRPQERTAEQVCRGARRIAILENIVDSTNIGAIFRSAAALGMDALLLSPSCCDPLCRRAVRVSMGTVFQVPWARLGQGTADWPGEGLGRIRQMGFRTFAMALRADAIPLGDRTLYQWEKLAIVLGTEGDGLAGETIACCDGVVRIPMAHGVDSLNVAAAAAVAFWELRVKEK